MKLSVIAEKIEAEFVCCETVEKDVTWCYCSDLLSDVMANAEKDSVWITLQTHPNIIAVASLIGLSAIIISRGANPDQETIDKAVKENIPVLKTKLPTFEAAGIIYSLLSR